MTEGARPWARVEPGPIGPIKLKLPEPGDGWVKIGEAVERNGIRLERGEDGVITITNAMDIEVEPA